MTCVSALFSLLLALPSAAQPAGAAASPEAQALRPITLQEAFALSLKRSETLAQDVEAYKQALARVDELRGDVLPHVNVIASEQFQENPHSGIASVDKTSYPLAQLQLTQPLFSGFREFLAFKAGKRTAESLSLTEKRAESLLYQDVAQAYLNLLNSQKEIAIRGEIVTATEDRINQLRHWVAIGRSRQSELLAARSQWANALSLVEVAKGQSLVAQEALKFLTGLPDDLAPADVAAPTLSPIEPFLAAAAQRDDVVAAEKSLEASRLNTSVAARQRWGQIGLTADYYLKRQGLQSGTHYDAIFGLNLPVFSGGVIKAQTEEAKAQERSSEQGLSLARRAAERDVRSSYRSLQAALSSVDALAKAADLAQQNLKAQSEDYRLSLVTNLEVLDSISTLQTTRLTLNAARQQAALAAVQLDVAAGGPKR